MLIIFGALLQKFVSIVRWGHFLGTAGPVPHQVKSVTHSESLSGNARQIREAISMACELLPLAPSCLAQAFAGQRVLKSRNIPGIVIIGLRPRKKTAWPAHAWLITEGTIVTGGAISHKYFPASAHTFGDQILALSPTEGSP